MMRSNNFSSTLLRGILTGSASGILFGFDTAVIAGSTALLTQQYHLSERALGITVSIALWGTVVGSLTAGRIAQQFGGRSSLSLLAFCYLISAIGCAFAPGWFWLLVARFVGGLGVGGTSVVGPVYIAEIAPARWRGRMVGLFQINVVLGVLLAYLSNFLLERASLPFALWRWQLGIGMVPAALLLLLLIRTPESPRWLISRGYLNDAKQVLDALGSENAKAQLEIIEQSFREEVEHEKAPLFTRALMRPLLLAAALAAFNQLSGINAILYYLNDVFAAAGYNRLTSSSLAVDVGLMNLVATICAISIIDYLGRRLLLLIGSVGMALSLASIAWIFHAHAHRNALILLLATYMVSFAISQGAVIWVYISEIFPNATRSRGQSLGSTTHWIMNAVIAGIFPVLVTEGMWLPFATFAAMMALQFVVVWFYLPETRGMTLEQITHLLRPKALP
ncbi:sugar porter family MFS transporter [Edaphobacter sp.]|uniref:sugar porter family MFS transporter n=1 Tax=Acidobacteriaceae TaxID=204434 RepID=UPI0029826201|nr:sugar porter family MFS transporter [Edaphobacter sp.]MDW5265395.1 sugar porter family MFS transporter [Edaphobacter sp.]